MHRRNPRYLLLCTLFCGCATKDTTPPDEPCTAVLAYADQDGDGVGAEQVSLCLADPTKLPANTARTGGDCDDTDPSAWQLLDGYADADHDGVTSAVATPLCTGNALPPGYLAAPNGADCDDHDPTISAPRTYFADLDGDGYGDPAAPFVACQLTAPAGYAIDNSDPDDHDAAITPLDTDGDHVANIHDCAPNDPTAWRMAYVYRDADHDLYYSGTPQLECVGDSVPAGYSLTGLGEDCDDNDNTVVGLVRTYVDADGDGYGAGDVHLVCIPPYSAAPAGYSLTDDDCNDADPASHRLFYGYADHDGDGYGAGPLQSYCAPAMPANVSASDYDYDDTNPSIIGRSVVTSVYQAGNPGTLCVNNVCWGFIDVILPEDVATDLTVSAYANTIWCVYGTLDAPVVSARAYGYYPNYIFPADACGSVGLDLYCPQTATYNSQTYYRKDVPQSGCHAQDYEGYYISPYDQYSAFTIVK